MAGIASGQVGMLRHALSDASIIKPHDQHKAKLLADEHVVNIVSSIACPRCAMRKGGNVKDRGEVLPSAPISTALIRDADGANAAEAFGWPVGYQPSVKYCRTRVADPAAMGVAMDVPRSLESAQSLLLLPLHASHECI